MVVPALIGAAASLAGGALGALGQSSANRQAQELANQNAALQKEFALSGVQWRAADVMHAYRQTGLHPLALLGVQPQSYAPQSVSFGNVGGELGKGISNAGQSVMRSMHASADRDLRAAGLEMQGQMVKQSLERGNLENELLRMKIASERALLLQGSMSPGIRTGAAKVVRQFGLPTEAGTHPEVSFTDTPRGGLAPVKSKQAQERLEDDWLGNMWWNFRNRVSPIADRSMLPRLPAGMVWEYNVLRGEYMPVRARRDSREMLNRFRRGW